MQVRGKTVDEVIPNFYEKTRKGYLTKGSKDGNIDKLSLESRRAFLSQPRGSGSAGKKKFEKSLKMFLTKRMRFDIIIKLSQNSSAENFPSIL